MGEMKFRQRVKGRYGVKDYWHYWGYTEHGVFRMPLGAMQSDERPDYQLTGLKDKNGKGDDVWEGDIIWHRNIDKIETDGVVHLNQWGVCIMVSGGWIRLDMIPNWKVVGNIEENPELLGKK